MTDTVQSAMLDILKRIQTDVAEMKGRLERVETDVTGIKGRLVHVEGRLESIDTVVKRMRRDNAGMLVMMRGTADIFNERVSDLERDVNLLMRIDR